MTNPECTTNEKIALLRGWTHVFPAFLAMTWKAPLPDGDYSVNAPDYEHDWAHAGPLLEEMWNSSELYWFQGSKWISLRDLVWYYYERGHDLLVAISRAWLAWKEEEK